MECFDFELLNTDQFSYIHKMINDMIDKYDDKW